MRALPVLLLLLALLGLVASRTAIPEHPSVEEIVSRNINARGGLDAWRRLKTMAWAGHIESKRPGAPPHLPFVLQMQRPNLTRFEISLVNGHAIRVFDGREGWKQRPVDGGPPEVVAYTPEELRSAADGQGFDGPLFDYQAKGVSVALEGSDQIEGRKTWRLNLTLPSGVHQYVWIDALTFLDVRYGRDARSAAGTTGTVLSANRDFRLIKGLRIPFVVETGVGSGQTPDRMVIERLALDPPVKRDAFERPDIAGRRNVVSVRAMPEAGDPEATLPSRPAGGMPAGSTAPDSNR